MTSSRTRYARRKLAKGQKYTPFTPEQLRRARAAREETRRLLARTPEEKQAQEKERIRKKRQRERTQRWRMRHIHRGRGSKL